ncbi:MAG: hypothetical protein K2X66_19000 [Cyanobacteria bacterium]|nr:hypothetical protein [Cyanobacteriota bacterium]
MPPIQLQSITGSLSAIRSFQKAETLQTISNQRLASGLRINASNDDAAGLQISEKLNSQIRGNQKALDNVQDGINLLKTVDGFFETITNIFQRQRELSVQAANATNGNQQLQALDNEFNQLKNEAIRLNQTLYSSGNPLLRIWSTGGDPGTIPSTTLQIGDNGTSNSQLDITALVQAPTGATDASNPNGGLTLVEGIYSGYFNNAYDPLGLPLDAGFYSGTSTSEDTNDRFVKGDSSSTIANLDKAINAIQTGFRAPIGATINRLQLAANQISNNIENQTSANSRIRSTDYAVTTTQSLQNQILRQSALSILTQTSQNARVALNLISS